jgi:predicted Zn-dependent protease
MRFFLVIAALCVASCTVATAPGGPAPDFVRSGEAATAAYRRTVARISPVAESVCRQQNPDYPPIACSFDFRVSTDPRLGLNAFQTIQRSGQPQVTFTLALLRTLENDDEVAFILGHETAHQTLRHILKSSAQQQLGAVLLGGLVASTGTATSADVNQAANLGAAIGSRVYSKRFELEADEVATYITMRAGYDPVLGAEPFSRMETGSSGFLATHPPSLQRFQIVRETAARIEADRRAGRPIRLP